MFPRTLVPAHLEEDGRVVRSLGSLCLPPPLAGPPAIHPSASSVRLHRRTWRKAGEWRVHPDPRVGTRIPSDRERGPQRRGPHLPPDLLPPHPPRQRSPVPPRGPSLARSRPPRAP